MKIGIIQGSTQTDKNELMYRLTKKAVSKYDYQVINFGVKPDDSQTFSYAEIAFLIALLVNSGVIDFVVTGCSSGQGMNLACNALPGLLSGFIQNPQDAFLFGRINDGNVASLALGLGFGWLGELNLEYTLDKLFDGEFGIGFPEEDAERKIKETNLVKRFNSISKKNLIDVMEESDKDFMRKVFSKNDVIQYVINNSKENIIIDYIKNTI